MSKQSHLMPNLPGAIYWLDVKIVFLYSLKPIPPPLPSLCGDEPNHTFTIQWTKFCLISRMPNRKDYLCLSAK